MKEIPVSIAGWSPTADEMRRPEELSTAKSPLEKPLSLLTEEDLAQITREECRRFLKHCGMRRPSWNKSQAIQQVISLKSLLEDRPHAINFSAAATTCRKPSPPPLHASLSSPTMEVADGSFELRSAPPAKDPPPYRRRDPIYSAFAAEDAPRRFPAAGSPKPLPGSDRLHPCRGAAGAPAEQLTIFYRGGVSVYDGVPSEKAQEIMQLAAAPWPVDVPTEPPVRAGLAFLNQIRPFGLGPNAGGGSYAHAPAGKMKRGFGESSEVPIDSREPVPEGPTSRKASMKRYLEKRNDGFPLTLAYGKVQGEKNNRRLIFFKL